MVANDSLTYQQLVDKYNNCNSPAVEDIEKVHTGSYSLARAQEGHMMSDSLVAMAIAHYRVGPGAQSAGSALLSTRIQVRWNRRSTACTTRVFVAQPLGRLLSIDGTTATGPRDKQQAIGSLTHSREPRAEHHHGVLVAVHGRGARHVDLGHHLRDHSAGLLFRLALWVCDRPRGAGGAGGRVSAAGLRALSVCRHPLVARHHSVVHVSLYRAVALGCT